MEVEMSKGEGVEEREELQGKLNLELRSRGGWPRMQFHESFDSHQGWNTLGGRSAYRVREHGALSNADGRRTDGAMLERV